MSFFDDLSKSLEKTGRTVANKATGLVDSTKLSHQISQEERAMDETYRQIGIAYFDLFGKDPAEQLAPMCDEIRRKLELLATLRQQEIAARGKRLCQNCGSECDLYQPFCYSCNAPLPHITPPGMRPCPVCSQDIPEESLYCPCCGSYVGPTQKP